MQPIRVLVVDDSAFVRYVLAQRLGSEPDLQVVDTACDGVDALEKVELLQPDVVTLDIEMPRMNGLDALRRIMAESPRPVIMLSTLTQQGARQTFRALGLGAVDFIPKPSSAAQVQSVLGTLKEKIRGVARVPVSRLRSKEMLLAPEPSRPKARSRRLSSGDVVVVIGASTGGPQALERVVSGVPADLPAGLAIVQHMPPTFTHTLAERLDAHSSFRIKEAAAGDSLRVGGGLVAPGDYHLSLCRGGCLNLSQSPPRSFVRPAADVTFETAARVYGPATLGVILTGMGSDGTMGARRIKEAGGRILAEAESSCIVYGMPKSVAEAGLVDQVVPLGDMASAIAEAVYKVREGLR